MQEEESMGKLLSDKDSDFKQNVARIKGKNGKELKETIVQMYPTLFKGLGIMEPEHHMKLNVNATPVVHPPRKITMGLRDQKEGIGQHGGHRNYQKSQ